jgi:hypothetical protein
MKLSINFTHSEGLLRNTCVPEPSGTGAKHSNSEKSDTVPRLAFWTGKDGFKKILEDITPVPEHETT